MIEENLLNELKNKYLKSIPEKIACIQQAQESKDWSTVHNEFHKLKGSGKIYGCPDITTFSQLIEDFFKQVEDEASLNCITHEGVELLNEISQKEESFDLKSSSHFDRIVEIRKKHRL